MLSPIVRRAVARTAHSWRTSSFRSYSEHTKPEPSKPVPAHTNFYKTFGTPLAKVFLGALFTYQVLHWSWLKLESLETKHQTSEEIERLEGQIRSLTK